MTISFIKPTAAPTLNLLLYGPPGAGKTTAACSAPGPILLLNAEGPNAVRFARQTYGDEKIHEAAFEGRQTLVDAYLHLRDKRGGEQTIVLDSIGAIHRILLEELAGVATAGADAIVRPTQQQWGDVNTLIERFCRQLRDLDLNVVLVCHEQVVQDEQSGETLRMPVTGGRQLPTVLTAMVDVVAYASLVPGENGSAGPRYAAQLVSAKGRYGKDRTGALGVIRDLDLSEWIAAAQHAPAQTNGKATQPATTSQEA